MCASDTPNPSAHAVCTLLFARRTDTGALTVSIRRTGANAARILAFTFRASKTFQESCASIVEV